MYSQNCKIVCCQVEAIDRYIHQHCIPQCSLLSVRRCPWRHVFMSGDDQAMITLTGFDKLSFHYLVNMPKIEGYNDLQETWREDDIF